MYLNLIILCGILPQLIIGNFTDQEIRKSSDVLLRQKRVISHIPGEDKKVVINDAPFITHLKNTNRISCVCTILSHHVVITITSCVTSDKSFYKVVSQSTRTDHGISHNVIDINKHYGGHAGRNLDGIALLTVNPAFVYGEHISNIELHSGPLLTGTLGTVFGWGFNFRSRNRGTEFPKNLRSIEVPIMYHRDCVDRYRPFNIVISDKDICTFHPEKHCGHSDGGAPLVIEGKLVGVHFWTGLDRLIQIDPLYPDVFAMLQHLEYSNWIRTMLSMIETPYGR